jgi:hypothetical protein
LMGPALFSSAKDDWNTPEEVLQLVRKLGPISLDPCSNAGSIVDAAREIRLPEDGLLANWAELGAGGVVFVNPPYGQTASRVWLRKITEEAARGAEIVALLPARPDTQWFQRHGAKAQAIVFWEGRLTFLGAPTSAPFPSLVLYYGPRPWAFLAAFEGQGLGVRP